jgi:hypothetical protein
VNHSLGPVALSIEFRVICISLSLARDAGQFSDGGFRPFNQRHTTILARRAVKAKHGATGRGDSLHVCWVD